MRQKLEINLLAATETSAKSFVADIDMQIAELEENLQLLKVARGAVARTFGMDRRDGSYVERLVDGAKRSEMEVSEAELERELALQIPPSTKVTVIDHLSKHRGVVK